MFLYALCGHVVTGDLSIVQNEKLRNLLSQKPEIQGACLIFIAPEVWYYYGFMWSVFQAMGQERGCRTRQFFSEWIKSIGGVVPRRIRRLKYSVNTRYESIFRDPEVVHELFRLHYNFVIDPVDKESNKYITFVCKKHYVDILIEELGLHLLPMNPTYNLTYFCASEVFDNHKSFLTSFGIQTSVKYKRTDVLLLWH